jgi:hypothetical protein
MAIYDPALFFGQDINRYAQYIEHNGLPPLARRIPAQDVGILMERAEAARSGDARTFRRRRLSRHEFADQVCWIWRR